MKEKPPEPGKAIDWSGLRGRLEAAMSAVERGWAPSPEERDRLLKERADALAVEPGGEKAGGDGLEVLEFVISSESYCIELAYLSEVRHLKEITPLPCTPPFVFGIINVRGRIIPVNDMRGVFGMPRKGLSELNKVIIVRCAEMELGILADEVSGVRRVPAEEMLPPPAALTGIHQEFLKGVTTDRAAVLDMGRFLTSNDIIVHEEA